MKLTLRYIQAFLLDWGLWTYTSIIAIKIFYEQYFLHIRRPQFEWGQFYGALLAGGVLAGAFLMLRGFSIGKVSLGLEDSREQVPFYRKPHRVFLLWQVLITFLTGLHVSEVSLAEFFSAKSLQQAGSIFGAMASPNFEIFEPVLFKTIETIYMGFIATVFALPVAFLLSFFAAKNLTRQSAVLRVVYLLTRFLLNLTRSIEPLVWAIIFSVWVKIGPFAGMLALLLHSIASLAKLYSEQIEEVSNGPIEAMKATGAPSFLVIWYGVVPQILNPFLSFTIYRWDINVRMATIIGMVGGGGIGQLLSDYIGLGRWHEVGLIVMVIAAVVWALDFASSRIRASLN